MTIKTKIATASICAAMVLGVAAGCTPDVPANSDGDSTQTTQQSAPASPEQQAVINAQEGITNADINEDAYPGKSYLDNLWGVWDAIGKDYAPEIRTLPNGQMVQRTPTEYEVNPDAWQIQAASNSYNTYWLGADKRGCEACHADLNAVLKNLPYEHPVAWNDAVDNKTTVQQCLFCHSYAPGYIAKQYEFGTLMHGIHYGEIGAGKFEQQYEGNCMSCHNATENGMGLELWDTTKYDRLWGINKVENVQGDFKIDQTKTHSMTEVFSYDWMHAYYDNMRHGSGVNGLNLEMPESLFNEWEITVEGSVAKPYTAKLPDLIAEAEADGAIVTKTSKMICNWQPIGGGGITNTEITGIPVSWLIDRAGGYTEDTTGVRVLRADGSSKRAFPTNKLEENEAFLVYEIGGERLDATRGYPCMNWVEGVDAQINSKQVATYLVTEEDLDYTDKWGGNPNAWQNEAGDMMNKPNATILGVPDGLIIQNNKPYTFNGYVDAYDQQVESIEFSMDLGKTWTKFDLGETDVNKLIWWEFTYTPAKEGAYCMTVRATTTEGLTSYETQTVMFNAKDVMPKPEDTTIIKSASLVEPRVATSEPNAE